MSQDFERTAGRRGHTSPASPEDPRLDGARHDFSHAFTTASLIATRGCSNRCTFCYLSTAGLHMPRQVRAPESVAREFLATGEPYGVFIDTRLSAPPITS